MAPKQVRTLVVDDHDEVRQGIVSLLAKQPGYRGLRWAAHGRRVLNLVDKVKPGVVLKDVSMPGADGWRRRWTSKRSRPTGCVVTLATPPIGT